MPARSRQALQHRPRRRLFVKMHRLRIELAGKRKDFLARHAARSERPEMAGRKIFEGQRHDGDCCKGGPIVAAICGNLNPPTRMARALPATAAPSVLVPDLPGTTFGARPCAVRSQVETPLVSTCRGRTTDV